MATIQYIYTYIFFIFYFIKYIYRREYDNLFKISIMGNMNVGKSSLISKIDVIIYIRYLYIQIIYIYIQFKEIPEEYISTIGVDYVNIFFLCFLSPL